MADLKGMIGELRFTVQVTRKATGNTETFEMVGFLEEEKLKQYQATQLKEKEDGRNP